ncbi:MAG TPA: hypothetical protein VLM79_16095, partial [Kofleriaceae bacterium]|nr:hypothetical protein [Kofleriaceae bacterium]
MGCSAWACSAWGCSAWDDERGERGVGALEGARPRIETRRQAFGGERVELRTHGAGGRAATAGGRDR